MKKCYGCGEERSVDMFGKNRTKPDGLATECKICKAELDRKYRARHKSKIKAGKHEYYLNNKDAIVEKVNGWIDNNRNKHRAYSTKAKNKFKIEVLGHYCDGLPKCKMCEKDDLDLLTIDHINGGGQKHRLEIFGKRSGSGGYNFYRWIKKNGFPDGFQTLCFSCQFKKAATEVKAKTQTHLKEVRAKYARSVKLECLDHYGGRVCVCGEEDADVLTLDHVNDDGAEHRKTAGSGNNLYHMLRKNGFPNDPPLQVLCINCNVKKRQMKYDQERENRQADDSCSSAVSV